MTPKVDRTRPECPVEGCHVTRIYPVDMGYHLDLQHPAFAEDPERRRKLMQLWMEGKPVA